MKDTSQLPYLLKLVDDESPRVRTKVARELRSFGSRLKTEIESQGIALTPEQEAVVQEILAMDPESAFLMAWIQWPLLPDRNAQLETAHTLLVEWQLGQEHAAMLAPLLDDLAEEYSRAYPDYDPETLSYFLFREKGLGAPEANDFYNPLNSNLVYVLESRRGIPISLASIFILVGHRLGLDIYGCNFPGHFLAGARRDDGELLFDCFNGGRVMADAEVEALHKAAPREIAEPAPTVTIMTRVVYNLVNAYHQTDDTDKIKFLMRLLAELRPGDLSHN
jgi:regulator of sirC expression with transglutaminase-like and TPR domain